MAKTMGFPQGYKEYQRLFRKSHRVKDMGFRGSPTDVNLFAHRLRMARAFAGIQLDGYTEDTKVGYEGLLRVFLTHSALELFLPLLFPRATGKPSELRKLVPLLAKYDQEKVLNMFDKFDQQKVFWSFFYDKCYKRNQDYLDLCLSREEVNVGQISAGIRHIFVHGHLTPNVADAKPKSVRRICDTLSDFLIEFMDQEFCAKVEEYCEAEGISFEKLGS